MTRVKRGVTSRKRHKKELKLAKGYRGTRSKHIKKARESLLHAGKYALRDRRARKGEMRRLWIVRLNAALKEHGVRYSEFIQLMSAANVLVNRKLLSDVAFRDPVAFTKLVGDIRAAAETKSP